MESFNGDSFVVDCNVIVKCFILEEEASSEAVNLLEKASRNEVILYAPGLIIVEFLNVLTKYNRLKTFETKESKKYFSVFLEDIEKKIINIYSLRNERNDVLDLALLEKISYFDAEYLYLSKKLKFELITYDKGLKKIANR